MISGGFTDGGESSSARKAHLRSIISGETLEVQAVSKLPRLDTIITFSNSDMEGFQHPHDDPLVIRAVLANKTVHRVLIDTRSSVDIIFASAFDKIGIGREKLEPVKLTGIHRRESATLRVCRAGTHFGGPPMQGHNYDKIPHSGCPIGI